MKTDVSCSRMETKSVLTFEKEQPRVSVTFEQAPPAIGDKPGGRLPQRLLPADS